MSKINLIIFGIISILIIPFALATYGPTSDHCFQPDAETPTDCGGLDNGSYIATGDWVEDDDFSSDFLHDDDEETGSYRNTTFGEGTSYLFIVYNTPDDAVCQNDDGDRTIFGFDEYGIEGDEFNSHYATVPCVCIDEMDTVEFRIGSWWYDDGVGEGFHLSIECYGNDEDWHDILVYDAWTTDAYFTDDYIWWAMEEPEPECEVDADCGTGYTCEDGTCIAEEDIIVGGVGDIEENASTSSTEQSEQSSNRWLSNECCLDINGKDVCGFKFIVCWYWWIIIAILFYIYKNKGKIKW